MAPEAAFRVDLAPRALPVPDLPPSARALYTYLRESGPRTHKDLVRDAGLPARTLRFATERLRRAGLVEEVPSLRDARQSYWRAR